MYSVLSLKIKTVAVVPDVLGRPCLVRGQESTNGTVKSSYTMIIKMFHNHILALKINYNALKMW